VLIWLLITLITAIVPYLLQAGGERTSVALLVGCVLVALVFVVLAIRVTRTYRRSRRLESDHGVPPNPVLRRWH
jgi:branched-subunit amino acid transport protein AzlD